MPSTTYDPNNLRVLRESARAREVRPKRKRLGIPGPCASKQSAVIHKCCERSQAPTTRRANLA